MRNHALALKQAHYTRTIGNFELLRFSAARLSQSLPEPRFLSLIFTLKDGSQFGPLLRRENTNVRAGLTAKILAYNLDHIIRMRGRRAREGQARADGLAARADGET